MAHKIYANSENGYWRVCNPLNVLRATNNTIRGKMNRHDVKRLLKRGYCDAIKMYGRCWNIKHSSHQNTQRKLFLM